MARDDDTAGDQIIRPRPRFPIPALNTLHRALGPLSPLPIALDADLMLRNARWMTGLHDFGDGCFFDALDLLLKELDQSPHLHPMGRALYRYYLSGFIRNRLKLEEAFARHPEIFDQPLEAPIVILGLPRTGTTLLHRLLAADPRHQSLTWWEAQSPVAPSTLGRSRPDWRRLWTGLMLAIANYLAPDLRVIHELRLDGPEECLHLFNNTFHSWIYVVQCDAANYVDWFLEADMGAAYRDFRKQLQLIDWQRNAGRRWILKTPGHLLGCQALIDTFPDARIIQTSRDPRQVIPSACSLTLAARRLVYTEVDAKALGASLIRQLSGGLRATREARRSLADDQQIDINYTDLVADPIRTVHGIYEQFGISWSAATETAMKRELAASPQHKHGRHRYSADEFGLTDDHIDAAFQGL